MTRSCGVWSRAWRPRLIRAAGWFAVAALLSHAGRAGSSEPPENVLAEFDVAPRGDVITLPVTIAGRTYAFALGTGVPVWLFDESLRDRLGEFADRVVIDTPYGGERIERYSMPAMRLGPLQVPPGKAGCADLVAMHERLGNRVHGVVPAEFLRGKIFCIDFDAGRFQFLRSVPDDAGARFDLTWQAGAPWLELDIPDVGKEQFLIASDCGLKTGSLREEVFDRLAATGRLKVLRRKDDFAFFAVESVAMSPQWGSARLDRFVVGQFQHEGAIFSAAPRSRLDLDTSGRRCMQPAVTARGLCLL